jgi:hypothetical protein
VGSAWQRDFNCTSRLPARGSSLGWHRRLAHTAPDRGPGQAVGAWRRPGTVGLADHARSDPCQAPDRPAVRLESLLSHAVSGLPVRNPAARFQVPLHRVPAALLAAARIITPLNLLTGQAILRWEATKPNGRPERRNITKLHSRSNVPADLLHQARPVGCDGVVTHTGVTGKSCI